MSNNGYIEIKVDGIVIKPYSKERACISAMVDVDVFSDDEGSEMLEFHSNASSMVVINSDSHADDEIGVVSLVGESLAFSSNRHALKKYIDSALTSTLPIGVTPKKEMVDACCEAVEKGMNEYAERIEEIRKEHCKGPKKEFPYKVTSLYRANGKGTGGMMTLSFSSYAVNGL